MVRIIDCFIFYNELELLTYRLHLLHDVVDYFIIVESTHTFTGKEKKLFFNENKHMYEQFSSKIIHIIVDDFPYKCTDTAISAENVWKNEYFQRNAISRGIQSITDVSNSDAIIISDLDEIPDPRTLDKIKNDDIKVTINVLQMDLYYYNLNMKFIGKWNLCKIISYEQYHALNKPCNNIRGMVCDAIPNGGWHLSYFGNAAFIMNKIQNFSHQEYNNEWYTNVSKIEERVQNGRDLYDRSTDMQKIEIKDNNYLPVDYQKYLNKYYS